MHIIFLSQLHHEHGLPENHPRLLAKDALFLEFNVKLEEESPIIGLKRLPSSTPLIPQGGDDVFHVGTVVII